MRLLSAFSGAVAPIMREHRPRPAVNLGRRSAAGQALVGGERPHTRWGRRRGLAVRAAPGRPRQPRSRMVRMTRTRTRTDAAVLLRCHLGGLADRPAHDQEQPHDRDLQQDHQPDERPGGHSRRSYTRSRIRTSPRCGDRRWLLRPCARQALSCSGAPLNWVMACSFWMRSTISLPVRRSIRSVPNSSTLNEASTVAWAIARRSRPSESSSLG